MSQNARWGRNGRVLIYGICERGGVRKLGGEGIAGQGRRGRGGARSSKVTRGQVRSGEAKEAKQGKNAGEVMRVRAGWVKQKARSSKGKRGQVRQRR